MIGPLVFLLFPLLRNNELWSHSTNNLLIHKRMNDLYSVNFIDDTEIQNRINISIPRDCSTFKMVKIFVNLHWSALVFSSFFLSPFRWFVNYDRLLLAICWLTKECMIIYNVNWDDDIEIRISISTDILQKSIDIELVVCNKALL